MGCSVKAFALAIDVNGLTISCLSKTWYCGIGYCRLDVRNVVF